MMRLVIGFTLKKKFKDLNKVTFLKTHKIVEKLPDYYNNMDYTLAELNNVRICALKIIINLEIKPNFDEAYNYYRYE